MTKKSIEESYKKLTQHEHILLKPGMYIGAIKKDAYELWVPDGANNFTKKVVEYSPGFIKIFDEILTNAIDHAVREAPNVTFIKVKYDMENGSITVTNNGVGLPILKHKEYDIYIPELVFGHLLSGSNYDENEERIVAGTNGLGAKAANIFSQQFIVETVNDGKKFIQKYSNNMTKKSTPKITDVKSSDYTKITFTPDYNRFGMTGLDEGSVLVIKKRVMDCIVCAPPNVKIYLNDELIKGKGLLGYIQTNFTKEGIISERVEQGKYFYEYAIIPATNGFDQISFVNGNATYNGGTHVDYILNQIIKKYKEMIETKKKLVDVKYGTIKEKMFLFLNIVVKNPTFNSQTKEQLSTPYKDFGFKIDISDSFINKLYKSNITDDIVEVFKIKQSIELKKKTDGAKTNRVYIPNLEDAVLAGTKRSSECTLILTEGLSAMTFALHGRSVLGIDKWGVFPLRGKALNVRNASSEQIINNKEIVNIKSILGLKNGVEYKDTSQLRYGKLMLLTDSDVDGTHIKGLLINFIHYFWPSLLKVDPNFVCTMRTPIVKAYTNSGKLIKEFFVEQDFVKWQETINSNYKTKYFKGLGSSTKEDAKDLFKRMDNLQVEYCYKNKDCDKSILLAFNNEEGDTDNRKKWLSNYDENVYIDVKNKNISYSDLIQKELIHFSVYDNLRSIPSLCDGFKPSQRKIMYYMLKNNITTSRKVGQLSGYISAETNYHHGEISLQQAIIGMAQDFVGSNNLNLLYPDGNFGTRLNGGKDAASPRYIFTRLADYASIIFNSKDNALLNYNTDDGDKIEPKWYLPILPMILVNGAEGIGTGYSTNIPPYSIKDIIDNIINLIDNAPLKEMHPCFRGYKGKILDGFSYGAWKRISTNKIQITELPIKTWIIPYKEFLENMVTNGKKIILKDVQNQSIDEDNIKFIIEFKDSEQLESLIKNNLIEKEFKLTKKIPDTNMYLFNESGQLHKYETPNDILKTFYNIRIKYYEKRRIYILDEITKELDELEEKSRFLQEYMKSNIKINNISYAKIIEQLENLNFKLFNNSYSYLLDIPISRLTSESLEKLKDKINKLHKEKKYYNSVTSEVLWKKDLEELIKMKIY